MKYVNSLLYEKLCFFQIGRQNCWMGLFIKLNRSLAHLHKDVIWFFVGLLLHYFTTCVERVVMEQWFVMHWKHMRFEFKFMRLKLTDVCNINALRLVIVLVYILLKVLTWQQKSILTSHRKLLWTASLLFSASFWLE